MISLCESERELGFARGYTGSHKGLQKRRGQSAPASFKGVLALIKEREKSIGIASLVLAQQYQAQCLVQTEIRKFILYL